MALLAAGDVGVGGSSVSEDLPATAGTYQPQAQAGWNGFVARLTEPVRAGYYRQGVWFLDRNGDHAGDASDSSFQWGNATMRPVSGDWNGDGSMKVGTYDRGVWYLQQGIWYLDYNGNGAFDPGVDKIVAWGWTASKPVVGDWNGNGKTKVGIFQNGVPYLDNNGNGVFDPGADLIFAWGWADSIPVIGDWNGDGRTKAGIFQQGVWYIDVNGNGTWDGGDLSFRMGQAGDLPLCGKWK